MIGRTGKDRHGAIDLLGQHEPRKRVRPGLGSEGEGLVGALDQGRIQAVGAADEEDEAALAPVAQGADLLGQASRRVLPAAFVAGDDIGALAGGQGQDLGLGGLARLAGFDLGQFDGMDGEAPARGRGGRPAPSRGR